MRVPFIPYVQGRNDYIDGDKTKYGLAWHNTSNDASDEAEVSYARRRTDGVSSHFYGDGDSVTQSIDTDDKCGHAGSRQGNENAICFELTGANGWTRAQWLANIDWELVGRVAAAVIRHHWPDGSFQNRRASVAEMKANPKIKAHYGHDDMRRAWGGTTHTDPGPNFPWGHLIGMVGVALGRTTEEDDDMFCKYGDKGPKVEDLQRRILAAGGAVGVRNGGTPNIDGDYGDNTARGLAALVGGDGRTFGPAQDVALLVKLVQKNSSGVPGPKGDPGVPGKTPTKVKITAVGEVIEAV